MRFPQLGRPIICAFGIAALRTHTLITQQARTQREKSLTAHWARIKFTIDVDEITLRRC
jgi:hypothetical protein